MSGTRSPFRKAPAIDASNRPLLLAVAHGAGARAGVNDAFLAFCDNLDGRLTGIKVKAAVLNGEPSLETVVREVEPARGLVVYPHFLSDGYYVRRALPQRLEQLGRGESPILNPLGLNAGLADLVARDIRRALGNDELPPVIVVAHGSAMGNRPKAAANSFAEQLGQTLSTSGIPCLFLEEAPFFEEALGSIAKNCAIVRFFAANGGHAEDDVGRALKARGHTGYLSAPVGLMPGVADLVATEVESAVSRHFDERLQLLA